MIKEKYKQLFLYTQFGGIRTMNIHSRCAAYEKRANAQIAHLVFADTQNANPKKPKELFLANTRPKKRDRISIFVN